MSLHPGTAEAIDAYLVLAGYAQGALFRPVRNNMHGDRRASITADGVYKMLTGYATALKIDAGGFGPHALRATAATNALEHEADIAKENAAGGQPHFQDLLLGRSAPGWPD